MYLDTATKIVDNAEEHVVRLEIDALDAVHADSGPGRLQVEVGFDPRPHGFEGVGILCTPQGAVGTLPSPFAKIIADGESE